MEEILRGPDEQAIASLYTVIRQDPEFFEGIDWKQFADTPLHIAAGEGRTLLALEIQRLVPSFCRKLNPDGLTPVDLALRRGHFETVGAMIKVNPELVRVQGREGITPLHYVAGTDHDNLLADLLLTCPESINELKVRGESAVHVAVRNGKRAAFEVLYGWLERYGRKEVLGWKDWEGNTIMHVAASTNQPEFMEELLCKKTTWVNEKNWKGLTALDIVMGLPAGVNNGTALKILQSFRGERGSAMDHPMVISEYLRSKTFMNWEKMLRLGAYLDIGLRSEMRNTLLVVAVLIVTATYQAVLSPPGGINKGDHTNINNSTPTPGPAADFNDASINNNTKTHDTFKEIFLYSKDNFYNFMGLNSPALALSLGFIFLLVPIRRYTFLLHFSMIFLMGSYMWGLKIIWPLNTPAITYTYWVSFMFFVASVTLKILLVWVRYTFVRSKKLFAGSYRFYIVSELVTQLFERKYIFFSSNSIG